MSKTKNNKNSIMLYANNFAISVITLGFLYACGGGGGGGGGDGGGYEPPATPAPTISISADPTSVLLSGETVLTWSSTNASSCTASGAWSGSKATSGTETVTISSPGDNTFTLTCSGDGGSNSASTTVEGFRNTDGVVVDGYISGAEVCIDENDNYVCDSNESSTTSDNDGKFTIKYANGNLVSIGGTDLDSQTLLDNLLITHKLTGHSDFKAVTPVTSVAAFMTDSSLVNLALGIDSSIDVFTFDPVANKGDGGINDYLYEKGNQLTVLAFAIQNITNNLNTTTETTQDYFKAITEEIEKEYTETESKVDIETEGFVTKAIENVIAAKSLTIAETEKTNTIKALSGMLPIIQVKSSDSLTTSVIRFAVSTLQTDIQAIANGTASAATVTSYTEDLLNYIAEDQSVNSSDIAPDISAITDTVSTSEDTDIVINVLLNDSYVTSSPFSLSATNGSNGTTSVTSNSITYSPDADYNGSDTFTYTLTQGDKTASADVNVTIEAVNDAPTINIASTIQVNENQTAVTTVSVSDVDGDDLTLTLGGTDADSFNLSSENVLTFKEAPDYETKTSYSITLSLTDGTVTVDKDVTIAIVDINDAAPVFTSDATFSAAENQTSIGTVTANDPEGNSFTFSISGDELAITSEGVLTFVTAPDYETKTTYTATVTVTDTDDNSATQEITVNVTNVNDNNPVFTSNSTFSVAENESSIGTATATDADGDDVTFTVSGSELEITSAGVLTFVTAPDYETKTSYTATVSASDGTNTTTQDITVNITNVNDVAPEFTSDATFSAAENQTAIGTVTATDTEGDDVTFTVSGSELEITSAGVLTFATAPDYETKTSYTATVTASDGTNSTTQDITVNVTNVNDVAPEFTSDATFSAAENQTAIGTVTATDAEGDTVTFTVSGSELEITSAGVLTFASAPDYETDTSFAATVTASDGTNSTTQDITVNVTNVNDNSPVITSDATFTAAENQTAIGTVIATDADGDDITFTVSGSELEITSAGVLTFATAPDYETKTSYTATVTASDGTNTVTQDITVNVTDANDPPTFTSNATFSAAENQTAIGTVTATDPEGDALSFTISGSDITIVSSTGLLEFASAPDYETQTSYSATVTVSDGTNSVTQDITVNVTNVNDVAPEFTSDATFSAAENQTAIGTVTATDAEGDTVTFTISGTDLEITSAGVLTFATAPDYETDTSFTATVTASDGTNSTTQDITVNVTNVNDNSPQFTSGANFSAEENQTAIGTVTATDADGDTVSFTISGSELQITSAGVLSFVSAPDYESKDTYTATVTASDGTNTTTQDITVTVTDVANETTILRVISTNNGGYAYVIDGQTKPTLTFERGKTYEFDMSDSSNAIHPLRFSTTNDGTHGGGSQYSDGVTLASGKVTIQITNSTPNTLYYFCLAHGNQGGRININ